MARFVSIVVATVALVGIVTLSSDAQFAPTLAPPPVAGPPVAVPPGPPAAAPYAYAPASPVTSPSPPVATPTTAPLPVTTLPEPIYWKQNLFLIPYQWSSVADTGIARAVILLVSKDRGATWQSISEAKPQVKAFNYHAEGDGEYWFAIRTIDQTGRAHPPGPYQPELRVIVDTSMPRFESLAARLAAGGILQIEWRANDPNLDPNSLKFEVQLEGSDIWQPLDGLSVSAEGHASGQLPLATRPRALRATVYDRAGNSAAFGAVVDAAPADANIASSPQNTSISTPQGWVSASDARAAGSQGTGVPLTQSWPSGAIASAPFQLSASASPTSVDGVTSYGNPAIVNQPNADSFANQDVNGAESSAQRVTPLEPHREPTQPFRRASLTRLPSVDGSPAAPLSSPVAEEHANTSTAAATEPAQQLPPGVEPKLIGSRTFALEYELEDCGRGGIAKVELWGTRDGGQTWRLFGRDDDHRSPLVVTVDDAGLYGFRIVVENAGGAPAFPPRTGEEPDLWVQVDLNQPIAELTSIETGAGNLANHLILHWRAEDDNLESRPIALFYSSRPAGPWTAIATNLEDTGEYTWQVERHVPDRVYLRLEARDTAGNLAAFQTREPVVLPRSQPSAHIQDVAPVGPTAAGSRAHF